MNGGRGGISGLRSRFGVRYSSALRAGAITLIASLLVMRASAAGEPVDFEITELAPAPGYQPTASDEAEERRQLRDGRRSRTRAWTRRDAVGWVKTSPIGLQIDLRDDGLHGAGTLRLHGINAENVRGPYRIDVYGSAGDEAARHAGEAMFAIDGFPLSEEGRWFDVPIACTCNRLFAIVHASDKVFVLDEVELLRGTPQQVETPSGAAIAPRLADLMHDSGQRYIDTILREGAEREADVLVAWPEQSLIGATLVAPYGTLSAETIVRAGEQTYSLAGTADESEAAVLAILNPLDNAVEVTVEVPAEHASHVELFEIRPVAAFGGQVVFDPLVAREDSEFSVGPRSILRIFVRVDLDGFATSRTRVPITVRSENGDGHVLDLDVRRVAGPPVSPGRVTLPRTTVWAYDTVMPIARDRPALLADLTEHHVNVNVVHPSLMPGRVGGVWDTVASEKLRKRLNGYPDGTLHLLALAWDRHVGLKAPSGGQVEWLRRLAEWWQRAERNGEWALYILDEPRGRKAQVLAAVATIVHGISADLPLYANPIPAVTMAELRALQPYVTWWQPHVIALEKHKTFFAGVPRDRLWFYRNPPYGAKRTPPAFYRSLGWLGLAHDTSGIGFWAHGDTYGSSAWNDFDGRRPDWAVVYEADGNLVSSRRWEAFRDGVEDYHLLTWARSRCSVLPALPAAAELSEMASQGLDRIRRDVLANTCMQDQ